MTTTTFRRPTSPETLIRLLPLGGVGYAVMQIAGDLTIGPFPEGNTTKAELQTYYAAHHAQVALGGNLLAWSAVLLALFVAGVVARTRSSFAAATVVAIGGVMAAVDTASGAGQYTLLGGVSTEKNLDPIALQALHQFGAEGGLAVGITVFSIGVLLTALTTQAIPVWVAIIGVVLGIAQLTPVGFLASMLFLLWCLVTGLVLTIRTGSRTTTA